MGTKLKADIAESAILTELLSRGLKVMRPMGDRLPYDLAIDQNRKLIRIQVKHAWYDKSKHMYLVDSRQTKTNRRRMIRKKYSDQEVDFVIIYLGDRRVSYIMPIEIFNSYVSSISIVEDEKRQRPPKSAEYRERWDLLSNGSLVRQRISENPSNSVEPLHGNTEPSPSINIVDEEGVETSWRTSLSKIEG